MEGIAARLIKLYFCHMKKRTIWTIAFIMGASFAVLIYLQMHYFTQIVDMRQKQFDENVKRALYQVAHTLELKETQTTIEAEIAANVDENESKGVLYATEADNDALPHDSLLSMDTANYTPNLNIRLGGAQSHLSIGEKVRARFLRQKELLNEVIYSTLYKPLDRPLAKRINRNELDYVLKTELQHNGIDLKKMEYHFQVQTIDGRDVLQCQDYAESGNDAVYRQEIFPNDPPAQTGFIVVRFSHVGSYIYDSVKFVLPSLVFTFVLLAVFIYTIYTIFRQKRLSEIKNDFINNMTHEFKTPISSISLAAQMLADHNIPKTPERFDQLSGIIVDETKRLRMQVEKVLQMAMFDRDDISTFKFQEIEAHSIIEEVVSTFQLKADSMDGHISVQLEADDSIIWGDPMHFTNLIYNLLDNGLKYRRPDTAVELTVSTANKGNDLVITVADNGIGIRRDDLKRIFERFFRVSTGNRHDVKGVGIGLAYVASVVKAHKGTIHAESEFGQGTRFIISIPLLEE